MLRYRDWPDRLLDFLAKRDSTPMKWGTSDCTLFAADAIQVMNGSDPAHHFRGKYTDKKSAFKMLKQFAGGGLEETTVQVFSDMGYSEIPCASANSGDVVLVDVENIEPDAEGLTAAIMANPTTVIAQGKDGLVYLENPDIKRAWAI